MAKALSHSEASADDRLRRVAHQRSSKRQVENLIVIGASAGGYDALRQVVRELSPDIPAAVIILLHMSPLTRSQDEEFHLDNWLGVSTHIPTVKVRSGVRLRSGVIFVAPAGMSVALKGNILQVKAQERGTRQNVTINTLFESAAKEYGHRVIGVIVTGYLKDGTDGLKAVHEAGGLTIVQDPKGAEYPDMPASAMKDLPVTFCLDLADIGPTLDLLARRETELETGLAASVRMVKKRVGLLARLIDQSTKNQSTSRYLAAEMIALQDDLHLLEAAVAKALVKDAVKQPAD